MIFMVLNIRIFREMQRVRRRPDRSSKPADLVAERPSKFELVSMKTAKAPGLAMPQSVLIRAHRMIEWAP
jgi:hypothetical protein